MEARISLIRNEMKLDLGRASPQNRRQKKLNDKNAGIQVGKWTDQEQDRFVNAVRMYGKDWQKITDHVGTRNIQSVRNFGIHLRYKLTTDSSHPDVEILEALNADTRNNTARNSARKSGKGTPRKF